MGEKSSGRRTSRTSGPAHWAKWTAAAGCLGALGYGGLKAIWAFGATLGMDDPAQLHPAGESIAMWVVANVVTVALAALAAAILLALVMPWGAMVPRRILRTFGWLGTIMVIPGAAGLAEILDYIAGTHLFRGTTTGGIDPLAFVFVYLCFLAMGLGFAATSYLTRHEGTHGSPQRRDQAGRSIASSPWAGPATPPETGARSHVARFEPWPKRP